MDTISITQLKTSPSKIIGRASDYPVAIGKRNKVQAYLVGKEIYETLLSYIETYLDKKEAKHADFTKGRNFEDVVKELNI